ncbi:hypothetical protein IDJ77_22250 [Mucilaginibacter sp. ZT4R22]|uniref:DUF2281 domain-containing protein n=1 Tax=Mucilaginibacter pankratovii TaxID=2772110 RepID=A0ABR7WW83_9SPHI|nr:hypothetical protein [Mucilaginibacter pankratovii]MBD1366552.1 hypothetical protein [Mucilaginibacter pankratovii]
MKSINKYNNIQKAKTLHQFPPNDIKGFIAFVNAHAEQTIAQKDELAKN